MINFDFPHVPDPGNGVDWQAICHAFAWLEPLSCTPQNPAYHADMTTLSPPPATAHPRSTPYSAPSENPAPLW